MRKLRAGIVSGIVLGLQIVGMLTLAFNIQLVEASGFICTIRADGSIDPSTAPIRRNADVYTLTDNIGSSDHGIMIERDNIVVDGAGFSVHGPGFGFGMVMPGVNNVTIRNMNVKSFLYGIVLIYGNNNTLTSNIASHNKIGIYIDYYSTNNSLSSNDASNNLDFGIYLDSSGSNMLVDNTISNSGSGIGLWHSKYNTLARNTLSRNGNGVYIFGLGCNNISGNNITRNLYGAYLQLSANNIFYHNNFINNTNQVYAEYSPNVWDAGYPSAGNYWSNYAGFDFFSGPYQNETGSDEIGDTSYFIDVDNRDCYPLMKPYAPLLGDLNDDWRVDIRDVSIVALAFGSYPNHPRWNPNADINNDNKIDIKDIAIVAKNFGRHDP